MAYFSNSTEGSVFEYQCSLCKYGEEACPIFQVQFIYNYDACNNEVARKILDSLVADNGECSMYKEFTEDFKKVEPIVETTLFDECVPPEHECQACGVRFGNDKALIRHYEITHGTKI